MKCFECPRKCGIDRTRNVGYCSMPYDIYLSKYMLHHWEEPIISGNSEDAGSGTIFFSGCNLKCIYCQNSEISTSCVGRKISTLDLVEIFKELENKGALNINLVTPTHYTDQIIEALKIYKPKVPIVWNSSGYELSSQIEKLKDLVDIYLVDLKYMDSEIALELSNAPDYPQIATKCILQMKKNQPKDVIVDGLMKKGVIVRHLVLPNCVENSFKCLDWIVKNLGKDQIISIMSQYTPCYKAVENKKINRPLHKIEYKRVLAHMTKLCLTKGFTQDMDSANSCYTPDFSKFEEL